MNMKKMKWTALLLVAIMVLTLAACGNGNGGTTPPPATAPPAAPVAPVAPIEDDIEADHPNATVVVFVDESHRIKRPRYFI